MFGAKHELFSRLLGCYSRDARVKRCRYSPGLLKPTGQPVPAYGFLTSSVFSATLTFKRAEFGRCQRDAQ